MIIVFFERARWSGWVWVGECFFWYRPTQVVLGQRPLNGHCYCCRCCWERPIFKWLPLYGVPSVLWCCWLGSRKGIRHVKKTERWGAGVVICLERDADLHMAQLMPLPLTVSGFSKIQIGFTFLLPAHPGSLGQRAVKRVCVCVCVPLHGLVWLSRRSYMKRFRMTDITSLAHCSCVCVFVSL